MLRGEEEVDDAEEGDGWRHDAEDEDHGEDQHVHRHMVGVVKLARLPDLLALFCGAGTSECERPNRFGGASGERPTTNLLRSSSLQPQPKQAAVELEERRVPDQLERSSAQA